MTRRTFTVAGVERIKRPKSGQVDHFDGSCPGLSLRVSYGGKKVWCYHFRLPGGKLQRMTLGSYPGLKALELSPEIGLSLKQARDAWIRARQEVSGGRDPSLAKLQEKAADDFATVAADWLRRDQGDNRSHDEVERIVNRELIPVWGPRPINDISDRDVITLLDTVAERAPVMARRVQSIVHRLCKWAVGKRIIMANPAAGLEKVGKMTSRDRVLTDTELTTVWAAAEQRGLPYGRAVQLLALTGARREEISQLKWTEIEDNTIKLAGDRTKNGEAHDIPLSTAAMAVFKLVPRHAGSDYVFGQALTGWSRAKSKLDELAGIEEWRVHDLRRTVATGLQKLGVNLQVTESVLGHTSGSRSGIVGVYQRHKYADEKRAALEAWGAHVTALIEGRKPGKVTPLHGRA
jgi:integrase